MHTNIKHVHKFISFLHFVYQQEHMVNRIKMIKVRFFVWYECNYDENHRRSFDFGQSENHHLEIRAHFPWAKSIDKSVRI